MYRPLSNIIAFVILYLIYRIAFGPTIYSDWYVPPFTAMAILLAGLGLDRVARGGLRLSWRSRWLERSRCHSRGSMGSNRRPGIHHRPGDHPSAYTSGTTFCQARPSTLSLPDTWALCCRATLWDFPV